MNAQQKPTRSIPSGRTSPHKPQTDKPMALEMPEIDTKQPPLLAVPICEYCGKPAKCSDGFPVCDPYCEE